MKHDLLIAHSPKEGYHTTDTVVSTETLLLEGLLDTSSTAGVAAAPPGAAGGDHFATTNDGSSAVVLACGANPSGTGAEQPPFLPFYSEQQLPVLANDTPQVTFILQEPGLLTLHVDDLHDTAPAGAHNDVCESSCNSNSGVGDPGLFLPNQSALVSMGNSMASQQSVCSTSLLNTSFPSITAASGQGQRRSTSQSGSGTFPLRPDVFTVNTSGDLAESLAPAQPHHETALSEQQSY